MGGVGQGNHGEDEEVLQTVSAYSVLVFICNGFFVVKFNYGKRDLIMWITVSITQDHRIN